MPDHLSPLPTDLAHQLATSALAALENADPYDDLDIAWTRAQTRALVAIALALTEPKPSYEVRTAFAGAR